MSQKTNLLIYTLPLAFEWRLCSAIKLFKYAGGKQTINDPKGEKLTTIKSSSRQPRRLNKISIEAKTVCQLAHRQQQREQSSYSTNK